MTVLVGRAGAAQILGVSESTTRNLQRRGLLKPLQTVGGRPIFSYTEVEVLKAKRSRKR